MNYGELLYVLRAACRGWIALLPPGATVPHKVVDDLATDTIALIDGNPEALHDARFILLATRPLSLLDHCMYTTVQSARKRISLRRDIIDSAAYDSVVLALGEKSAKVPYIVDLLEIYSCDILHEAQTHLVQRAMASHRPDTLIKAKQLLQDAIEKKS